MRFSAFSASSGSLIRKLSPFSSTARVAAAVDGLPFDIAWAGGGSLIPLSMR